MIEEIYIFDICDTLYESNTTLDFIYFIESRPLKRLALKLIRSTPSKVINKISNSLFKIDFIRSFYIRQLDGLSKETLCKKADSFVQTYLSPRKNIEVFAELSSLPKESIFLASATIDPVAMAIAKEIGVNYVSSQLAYDSSDNCLGTLATDMLGDKSRCFENKKISLVVTDNKSDLKLCQMADAVIAVSKQKNTSFWRSANIHLLKIIPI